MLASIIVLSLRNFRRSSWDAVEVANLRSHTAIMTQYTTDYKGCWPFLTEPSRATGNVLANPDRDFRIECTYFGPSLHWNVALASQYYGGDHFQKSFFSPRALRRANAGESLFSVSYWYSCSLFARPEYWDATRLPPPTQLGATRSAEVVFPAKKAVLLAFETLYRWEDARVVGGTGADQTLDVPRNKRVAMGLADGSAPFVVGPRPGYHRADGAWDGLVHGFGSDPALHTIGGVRGMDVD